MNHPRHYDIERVEGEVASIASRLEQVEQFGTLAAQTALVPRIAALERQNKILVACLRELLLKYEELAYSIVDWGNSGQPK